MGVIVPDAIKRYVPKQTEEKHNVQKGRLAVLKDKTLHAVPASSQRNQHVVSAKPLVSTAK